MTYDSRIQLSLAIVVRESTCAFKIATSPHLSRRSRSRPRASRSIAAAAAAFGVITWTMPSIACDLAFVMDHSGSMGDTIRGSGRSRCADASCYAATAFNYYRCGASFCKVTTAATPVDYFIDGSTSNFDFVYNNPANGCSAISGKRVNVYSFNGTTGFHSVTLGIGSDPQGWVSLADNTAADAVLAKIASLATGCEDTSPLADALCSMPPLGDSTIPMKKMKIVTDGGENASTGACSGPEDPTGTFPFSSSSWENKVYVNLASPAAKWNIDTTLFVPPTSSVATAVALDLEMANGALTASSPTVESNFFTQLDTVTYGTTTIVADNASIAPCQGQSAPATPNWGVAGLAALLACAGISTTRRRAIPRG